MNYDRRTVLYASLITSSVLAITGLHYLTSTHLLAYHSIYRSLYYLPITGAAVAFGWRGGVTVALLVIALFVPHALALETLHGGLIDNLLELPLFLLVGTLVGVLVDRAHLQRRRAEALSQYVDGVLQSVPLGVATARPGAPLQAQNRAAHTLLARAELPTLSEHAPGYHQIDVPPYALGLYVAELQPHHHQAERVYVLEDLTEQRALEAQLRRVDRLASVGQLAAGVAHEVRNPLAILRATAQLLANRATPDIAQATAVLVSEADRIDRLISELLAYARPRPPQRTQLDLDALLSAAAQSVHAYAAQHQIAIVHCPTPPLMVHADAEQLRQALINVLLNAIQASPPTSTVRLWATQAAHTITIHVADDGCGMTTAVREHACDPFFTTRPEGTGLGLALVASIVQEHAGTLHIVSMPDHGTTVSLSFPHEEHHGAYSDH
jgi:signal transduction histidine kinase